MTLTTLIFWAGVSHAASGGHGWPSTLISSGGADLYRALEGRSLSGADALGVFLALVSPGRYRVRGAHQEFDLNFDVEASSRDETDFRVTLGASGRHLGRTFLLLHADETRAMAEGYNYFKLITYGSTRHPTIELMIGRPGQQTSYIRASLTTDLRRLKEVRLGGRLLDHLRDLASDRLVEPEVRFTFTDWRPAVGLELDCHKLLAKFGAG